MIAWRLGNWTGYATPHICRFATTSTAAEIWKTLATYSCSGSARRRREFLMRILYCNKYNFPFSGTEMYLFELMELMRAQGHEVALFSMADPRGEPTAYDRHFVSHIDFKSKAGWSQKVRRACHGVDSTEARRRTAALVS